MKLDLWLTAVLLVGALDQAIAAPPSPCTPVQGSEAPEEKPLERLEAWPEVDKKEVKLEVSKLQAARTEEMANQADVALRAVGAGAVPFLLPKFGKTKDEAARERMQVVLEAVTDARHTRLLAAEFTDKSSAVRAWCLRRVALFPDPGVRASAEAALAKASKKKRDQDPEEIYLASLCCASTGSFTGFDKVVERARKDWGDEGKAIHTALVALRSPEGTRRVAALLDGSRKDKVAGLRLLAACGELESAKPLVRPYLDDNDNSLRVAAINALRGIVDGAPPLDKLSVFEAIERANKWKSRL